MNDEEVEDTLNAHAESEAVDEPDTDLGSEESGSRDDEIITPHAPTAIETSAEQSAAYDRNKIFLPRSPGTDQIAGRFIIRLDAPIREYDNDFCKAFEVADNTRKEDGKYYALIFEKGIPIRLHVMDALRKRTPASILCPVATEITSISSHNEQRVVVILPKPHGITLSEYIAKHGPCSEYFIIEQIITPLNILLHDLSTQNISHGNINADTIRIDDQGHITVGECISQVCGYSQSSMYESLERASVMPIGKGDGDSIIDYYALGVLSLVLILGRTPLKNNDEETFLETRLTRGSYNALTRENKIPAVMEDLLKGLISDKKNDCWQFKHISDWIKGKKYNIIAPTSHIEASRQITFNGKDFYNCRALVNEFHKNWDIAKKFLKDESLIKWIERSVKDASKASRLRDTLKMYTTNHSKNALSEDDFAAISLLILDPDGVIRFKEIGTHLDAFPQILAYGMASQRKDLVQFFVKMIHAKLTNIWMSSRNTENKINTHSSALGLLERAIGLIDETSLGFGIERCLYEVNPSMACQSDLLFGEYITTLPDLLNNLDKHAHQRKELFIDRHIAAFMTSRMEMKTKLSISSLSKYPNLDNHNEVKMLMLLALAQKHAKIKRLRNLSDVMEQRLISIVRLFNSKTIREEISLKLKTTAKSGDLMAMLKIVSNPTYMQRDKHGFLLASNRFEELENKVLQYDNKRIISSIGYRYGLQMSYILGYLFCSIVIVTLVIKAL